MISRQDITIILPTKNEEETIPSILPLLRDYNVIVVDDSDNDLTRQAAEKVGGCIFLRGVGNESPSIKHALKEIIKNETLPFQTKYCVVMDCDGSHSVDIISDIVESMIKGTDLVVGSRYVYQGDKGSSNAFSSLGNLFAKMVLKTKTKDLTGRYVAAKPELLLKLCDWKGRGEDSISLIFNAENLGYEVKEIPFVYHDRVGGKSKTNIPKYLVTYLWKVFSLKWDSWILYSRDYIARGLNKNYIETDQEVKIGIWTKVLYFFQVPIFLVMSIPCRIPVLDVCCNFIATNFPRGIVGFFLRGVYWKTKLGGMGKNCFIDVWTSIMGPENVFLGNNVHLDEKCSILCVIGKIRIEDYNHVAMGCILQGKGGLYIGEKSTISALCKIYSASNYYKNEEGRLMSCSAMASMREQTIIRKAIYIGEYAFIGAGVSLIPGGSVGNHSVIGTNSVVNTNIPDFCVAVGSPAKVVKKI